MKKKKYVAICYLEHHPYIDRLIQIIIKPLLLAGLYSTSRALGYIQNKSKSSLREAYFLTLLREAHSDTFKRKRKNWSYFLTSTALNILSKICCIDNAYEKILQKTLKNYCKKAIQNKYDSYHLLNVTNKKPLAKGLNTTPSSPFIYGDDTNERKPNKENSTTKRYEK